MTAVDFMDAHRIVLTGLVFWAAFNCFAVSWLARVKGSALALQTLAGIDAMSVTLTQFTQRPFI